MTNSSRQARLYRENSKHEADEEKKIWRKRKMKSRKSRKRKMRDQRNTVNIRINRRRKKKLFWSYTESI